jgi:hypothetical protein
MLQSRRKQPAFAFSVPHYRQSLPITCGPSCLLMAMKTLDRRTKVNRTEELDLFREMTMILWPSDNEIGGCAPPSLALAAARRGFHTELALEWQGGGADPYKDMARPKAKQKVEVVRLLWQRDLKLALKEGVRCSRRFPGIDGIEARFDAGWLPILFVNCTYLHHENDGHYVVVTGFDDQSFYINDPWIPLTKHKTAADMTNRRIPRRAFNGIAWYGPKKLRAVVFMKQRHMTMRKRQRVNSSS